LTVTWISLSKPNWSNRENTKVDQNIRKKDSVIYPDLSYKIIGCAFSVFRELGWGYSEKDYEKALEIELSKNDIKYERQRYIPVQYKGQLISKYFADFIAEEKILLELKIVSKLGYSHIHQVLPYLKAANLRLGILIYFTPDGVKYRRVVNVHKDQPKKFRILN
jgi:GxxExxY protein